MMKAICHKEVGGPLNLDSLLFLQSETARTRILLLPLAQTTIESKIWEGKRALSKKSSKYNEKEDPNPPPISHLTANDARYTYS